jgi:hypothetical protein
MSDCFSLLRKDFHYSFGVAKYIFRFPRDTLYIKPSFLLDKFQPLYRPVDPLLSVTDTETFAKVENQAFLVDRAEHGWDIYEDTSAEFLIYILRIFPHLKNFTFVLRHYLTSNEYEPYVLTNPIHLDPPALTSMNGKGMSTIRFFPRNEPEVGMWSKLGLKKVELQRANFIPGGITWAIPNIHYKVAVPRSNMGQQALDSARYRSNFRRWRDTTRRHDRVYR